MRRLLGAVLLAVALAGCGQQSRTVDVGPARPDAVARAEQVRLSLLPVVDAARASDAAHTAELDRLRAENAALHARLASTSVVRSTASRGAARPSVRTGPCGGWEGLIGAYGWNVGEACRVAWCESRWRADAHNASGHNGLFQIAGGPMDPAANVRQAFAMYQSRGWQPWDASRGCWS